MGLSAALSIANSGLSNINTQFSLLSQNVTNASTPGYMVESAAQTNLTAGGDGLGVREDPATLNIDQTLQSSSMQQSSVVSGLQTTQSALQAIDSVLGTPGSGYDLGSQLGNLQNAFSTLLTDPSSQTQQTQVVSAASTLAQGINSLSAAYTAQRQAAQTNLQTDVNTLNTTLTTIGQLNTQIMTLRAARQSTADLENQRNQAVQTLSGLMQVNTTEQPNGDLSVFTASGLSIPVDGTPATFAISPAEPSAENYYPGGGLSGITLSGTDVTSQLVGGSIGASITLRDQTLPTDQAELDEFAYNLANRFSAQGLDLFTDGSGNVPTGGGSPTQSGYVGFSAEIQVNPAVAATPSLVRDGTEATAGSPTGVAAFTPNASGGPAGFSTLISNVLNYTFGSQAQSGVPQPDMATSGLGPTGTLTAPFSGSGVTLSDYASNLVASQAQQSATTTSTLSTEQTLQDNLNAKIASVSGVNMDTEMSQMLTLQNAYGANAKVIAAIQAMFQQIMGLVQ